MTTYNMVSKQLQCRLGPKLFAHMELRQKQNMYCRPIWQLRLRCSLLCKKLIARAHRIMQQQPLHSFLLYCTSTVPVSGMHFNFIFCTDSKSTFDKSYSSYFYFGSILVGDTIGFLWFLPGPGGGIHG